MEITEIKDDFDNITHLSSAFALQAQFSFPLPNNTFLVAF
jgi:hypothetical protein